MPLLFCQSRPKHQPLRPPPAPLKIDFNTRKSSFKSTQYDQHNTNSNGLKRKRKHKKYFSCECSPASSPLKVKKELLQDRHQPAVVLNLRDNKVKRKQKTECFNAVYLQHLKSRKETMNWVRYNIEVGLYALTARIRQQFQCQFWQNKEYHKIKPELAAITKSVQYIQQFAKTVELQPLNLSHQSRVQQKKTQKDLHKEAQTEKPDKLPKYIFHKLKSKENRPQIGKPVKVQPKSLKQAVQGLNSALCLLSRKISLQKQNQLIKQFFEQQPLKNMKSTDRIRFSAEQLSMMYQILQINSRRCSILNDLADRVVELEQFKLNFKFSEDQIKQLQELNIFKNLELCKEDEKDEEINKIAETIQSILHNSSLPFVSKNCLKSKKILKGEPKDEPKKAVRIAPKRNKSIRASIEFLIEQLAQAITHKGQPNKHEYKQRTRGPILCPTNHEMKLQAQIVEPKTHFYEPKIIKKKELAKPKPKKALAFANDICEPQLNRTVKSIGKSSKSIGSKKKKSKKQIKEGGSQYTVTSSKFVSIKSLRSMRSINSNESDKLNKSFARSLKTQRQIKFLKNKSNKMSGIRVYRSKIFKFNEDFSNLSSKESDLVNFGTRYLEVSQQNSSEELVTSLNNLISQSSNETSTPSLSQTKQSTTNGIPVVRSRLLKRTAVNLDQFDFRKVLKIDEKLLFHRKPKKAVGMRDHPDDKDLAIKNFLTLCTEIKSGKHIVERKKLFYQHFYRLYQNNLINEEVYQKYFKYFHQKKTLKGKSKVLKLNTEQEEQQPSKKTQNPYQSLVSLRKNISQNRRLSQINKYYYNFDQFKSQQEEIDKTKQRTTKDDEFFNIKSYVDHKEAYRDPIRRNIDHFNSRYLSQDEKLLQKEI